MLPQKVLHLHIEEAKKKPNIDHTYIVSSKIDGWYVYADYINGEWSNFHSRVCREIPSLRWAKHYLNNLPKPNFNCRIIAEAVIPGLDFHTANGRFNRTLDNYEEREVVFYFHDIINLDTYWKNQPENYASVRYARLHDWRLPINIGIFRLHTILGETDNRSKWLSLAEEVWSNDGEGVVLKRADAIYQPDKKNSSLMKIKLEAEFDLLVIDYFSSIGEKGNLAWNMKLQDKSGTEVNVRVGKDSDIAEFAVNNPVGKVALIRCMKKLPDSYREPRFVSIRYDKLPKDID
ncbi:MAG: hypothetical protein WC679_12720 [Bacteroidales bacterium]|jgi:ATP-dependent DNA ligase